MSFARLSLLVAEEHFNRTIIGRRSTVPLCQLLPGYIVQSRPVINR